MNDDESHATLVRLHTKLVLENKRCMENMQKMSDAFAFERIARNRLTLWLVALALLIGFTIGASLT